MTFAHAFVGPTDAWNSWEFQPLLIATALVVVVLYSRGVARTTVGPGRAAAFHGGLGLVLIAAMSPLHALGETLFTAHMIQHLILVVVAAPLLAFGRPATILAGLPREMRLQIGRWARVIRAVRMIPRNPVVVWCAGTVVMWAWHLPRIYEAAVRSDVLHGIEHTSFLTVSFMMWRLVPGIGHRPMSPAPAVGLIFATALQSAALGAILTFAARPLYEIHAAGASAWGILTLTDQQFAGAVMWIPPGIIYLATMAVLLHAWFTRMDALYSSTERPG